jgi:RNA polymerase sigma-70 factor (ECF subfamily)
MDVNDDPAQRFSELYGALYGRVRAYAARRVGPDAADEVAAETFTIAWRRFEAIPAEPLPWLYGVARNVVARHRAGVARQAATRDALERERTVSAEAFGAEDEALWDAWHRLREADREVLALIAWEELSVAEASDALGCPAPVFSVRLHRARRRLERLLAKTATGAHPVSTLSVPS